MDFNALHHQPQPMLIASVWDASSALAAEQSGYHALGTSSAAIAALASKITVPLNVMCMPALPDFNTLATLGVKRISMGNFIHATLQARLTDLLCKIQATHSFSDIFGHENNR